jgi:hypothetical protein
LQRIEVRNLELVEQINGENGGRRETIEAFEY